MSTLSRCPLTLALALGAMLAACNGGGGTATPSPGPAGTQSVGCGGIEVVNDSDLAITVEVRYGFGEYEG